MSILIKPYEISVWDDVWENGEFVEKRIGVIGSDKMMAQCRVIEPNLVRNVNGSKKFSFKMYHKYIDNMTGEETINPFSKWMISERKVKLHYEDKWYDFVIKNISENSSNYLYTYQLEDAIVTELSKNGFGTILDAELQNNMGSAEYLAKSVLSETDWEVESEKFVEQVEENLVYAKIDFSKLPGKTVYQLIDSHANFLKEGVKEDIAPSQFNTGEKTVLAFYSACKNKPYRFQFIYLDDYSRDKVKINKNNRTIQEKDCQYFIEFWPNEYVTEDKDNGFIMPNSITILSKTYSDSKSSDGTISVWYKGNRYGYAQKAMYSPVLDRYINEYKKLKEGSTTDYDTYYGFVDNEYISPTLTTNLVGNTEFKNTSGWIGASTTGASADKAIVENVYGRFSGTRFISSMDDLKNGVIGEEKNYCAYMRITLPNANSIVFNDGLYDKRKSIGNMPKDSEWAFKITCAQDETPNVAIGEYESSENGYKPLANSLFSISQQSSNSGYNIYKIDSGYGSETTFTEQSHIRIALTGPKGQDGSIVYYIKEMEFFRACYNNSTLITPSNQTDSITQGVVIPTYYYFSEESLNKATSLEDLEDIDTSDSINKNYLPVFNDGAEKIRSVTVQESNHFNNLQSIAETFECWVDFYIGRDALGAIDSKKVKLKNYAGKNNYACFRYGVNLKDIQRTYESKNITTKLIVKQNNNELGEDGFCTIQRAGANPTGESYIYDFQYYQNIGLMSADQYIDVLYKMSHNNDSAVGPDQGDVEVTEDSECNIQGYFPRLRELNRKIIAENKLAAGIVNDLREKSTQLKVAETMLSAAKEGIEEVSEDFLKLTGFYPWEICNKNITSAEMDGENKVSESYISIQDPSGSFYDTKDKAKEKNGFYSSDSSNFDFSRSIPGGQGVKFYKDHISLGAHYNMPNLDKNKKAKVYFYPKIYLGENDIEGRTIEVVFTLEFSPDIATTETVKGATNKYSYCVRTKYYILADLENQSVQNYVVQYNTYKQEQAQQEELLGKEYENGDIFGGLRIQVQLLTNQYNTYYENINRWTKQKAFLNKEFYKKYSRFIQEGTWIGEEYVDDDKYYADALSVIYNSCYPQVAYSINVLTLSSLPGYEDFVFEIGDKTYAIDPEFFGDELKEEVVITEMSNMLDSPDKDTIKVQNFKNQFQDLFQKITATSQQVQYNAGSYEKGAALAEAITQNSIEFLTQTLDEMTVNLSDPDLESTSTDGSSAIKIVDGKILFGKKKENGSNEWTVGMSSKGISANKITAGQIDTGVIQIMSGTEPAFRWDAYGISAFGNTDFDGVISGVTTDKFVRFDKYGLYGMEGVDGLSWHATGNGYDMDPLKEIDALATFSLTWQGLKVTGYEGVEARFGRQVVNGQEYIIYIKDNENNNLFSVTSDGSVSIAADLDIGGDYVQSEAEGDGFSWKFNTSEGFIMNSNGSEVFKVDSTGAKIAGWEIQNDRLYGVAQDTSIGITSEVFLMNQNSYYNPSYPNVNQPATVFAIKLIKDNVKPDEPKETYPFYVRKDGTMVAEKGTIGGWTINNFKLYAGGTGGVPTVAIQAPMDNVWSSDAQQLVSPNWVFAAGGQSHDSYADCPFRVDREGKLWATKATIGGHIDATSGTLGPDGLILDQTREVTISETTSISNSADTGMVSIPLPNCSDISSIEVNITLSATEEWRVNKVTAMPGNVTLASGFWSNQCTFTPQASYSSLVIQLSKTSGATWIGGNVTVKAALNFTLAHNLSLDKNGYRGRIVMTEKPISSSGYRAVYVDALGRLCY